MRQFKTIVVAEDPVPTPTGVLVPEVGPVEYGYDVARGLVTATVAHIVSRVETSIGYVNVCTCGEKGVFEVCPNLGSYPIVDDVPVSGKLPSISKGFLFAGRATLVAENANTDEHFTFRVGSAESEWPLGSGQKHITYFLNVKAPGGKRWPNGSQSPWRYIGILRKEDGHIKPTGKSEFTKGDKFYDVAAWTVRAVVEGKMLPAGYAIRHAGKCGKCGRELTDPESLDRGIGPDCWEQMGRTF